MDYEFIFSLVFSLLVIMIVGGGILLFPITRRLGLLLEAESADAIHEAMLEAAGSLPGALRPTGAPAGR